MASAGLTDFLSRCVCIRIQEYKEQMSVSDKTAILHLKRLEQCGLLSSQRIGRDRYYFNSVYTEWFQQMAGRV